MSCQKWIRGLEVFLHTFYERLTGDKGKDKIDRKIKEKIEYYRKGEE